MPKSSIANELESFYAQISIATKLGALNSNKLIHLKMYLKG